MGRWFRFYDEALDDPKVQRLSGDKFKIWVNLLCLSSKNEGFLPSLTDLAFALRASETKALAVVAEFCELKLLDIDETGPRAKYSPHNWNGRQYLSDTSKSRVQRHRDKRAAAGLIPQWTAPAALRKAVYEADNFECVYCAATEFLSIDHKTSEFHGGTHDFENLVTACRSCNGAKRDLSFDEYVTRTNIVTLHGRYQKRPQSTDNRTEHIPERKKDGAKAPVVELFPSEQSKPSEEKSYYDRFKEIVGPRSGGLAKKLLLSQKSVISDARSVAERAASKSNPSEYIGAVIKGSAERSQTGVWGDDWGN